MGHLSDTTTMNEDELNGRTKELAAAYKKDLGEEEFITNVENIKYRAIDLDQNIKWKVLILILPQPSECSSLSRCLLP